MTPLHDVGNFLRDLLLRVPLPVARALFIALPAVLLVWVLRLPREETMPLEPHPSAAADLRWWAAAALAIQIAIYTLL